MLSKKSGKNWIQSILVTTRFLENFGGRIFIFGHFINVQFSKQPINNDCKNNNSNTYLFYYLKKLICLLSFLLLTYGLLSGSMSHGHFLRVSVFAYPDIAWRTQNLHSDILGSLASIPLIFPYFYRISIV